MTLKHIEAASFGRVKCIGVGAQIDSGGGLEKPARKIQSKGSGFDFVRDTK